MYTISSPDGSRNLVLEKSLGVLEDKFVALRRNNLKKMKPLNSERKALLCEFVAAMLTRTPAFRAHHKNQWSMLSEKMDTMMKAVEGMSANERMRMHTERPATNGNDTGLDYEQVKDLAENPLQHMMLPWIVKLTPLLYRMNLLILCTNDPTGFITSDDPCVWFDPEACKRPPFYQTPGLMFPNIEVTLPISPRQAVLISHHDYNNGYIDAPESYVDEMNRRTLFHADSFFIVNGNTVKSECFDPGVEPEDSWRKKHNKKEDDLNPPESV